MGSAPPARPLPFARLAGVGAVVFAANAALLVLQLVASRLLAPFIGSDLYTWTSIIGVFMAGIALGNAYGGKLADRYPSPRTLAALLAAGAVAAVWMAVLPTLLAATGWHRWLPLGPRIPVLSAVLCLPAGFALSLLTPVAIKLGLPDVSKTGRVAGMVFALSTLGCLLGNYVTGFYLIPAYTINTLVYAAAGTLLALAVGTFVVLSVDPASDTPAAADENGDDEPTAGDTNPFAFADIRRAYLVVFLASFAGMTLELAASRVIAQSIGVSLYSWTGVIGVMLAGTAVGNLLGGVVADQVNRPRSGVNPRLVLAGSLIAAGGLAILVLVVNAVLTRFKVFADYELIAQILTWTFALFFAPMMLLGTISPQVIRLAVPDVAHAGRVAGRVYAWSTAGAIAGTFAAGYVFLSGLGVDRTIIGVGFVLAAVSLTVARVWEDNTLLYLFSVVLGGVTGGIILTWNPVHADPNTVALTDTNYYRIRVAREGPDEPHILNLYLDHLLHSTVNLDDPLYLYYAHEQIQIEFLRAARAREANPKVLLVGGGGYTFPRCAKTLMPEAELDVVEIDPGVTRAAYETLGMRKEYGVRDYNMDGRQFVAERAAPGSYDLVIQDAVNDLSVPAHLLTREYNDEVKRVMKRDGVYLLTVIDTVEYGKLWRAAMATLGKTFPHVALLSSTPVPPAAPADPTDPDAVEQWERDYRNWADSRAVYVIYASDRPLDTAGLRQHTLWPHGFDAPRAAVVGVAALATPPVYTHATPAGLLAPFLEREPGVILTDQFAPVDNLMAEVFRRRYEKTPLP